MNLKKFVNIFVGGFMLNPLKYRPEIFINVPNLIYQNYDAGFFSNPNTIISNNIQTLEKTINNIDSSSKINLIGHSAGASIVYKYYIDNLDKKPNLNSLVLFNPVDFEKVNSIVKPDIKFNDRCYLLDSLNDKDYLFGIETSPSDRDYRIFQQNFKKSNVLLAENKLKISHNDVYKGYVIFNAGKSKNNEQNIKNYCQNINLKLKLLSKI
jgi:hypothetical protein